MHHSPMNKCCLLGIGCVLTAISLASTPCRALTPAEEEELRVYHPNLAFDFRAEGGGLGARLGFANSLLMNGLRGDLESLIGNP